MKRILLLSALFAVMAITGCKKDKDENPNAKAILGKWFAKSYSTATYTNGVKTDSSLETEFTDNDYVEFRSDGTATDGEDTFTYSVNGNTITTTSQGETLESEITTLSGSTLGLTIDVTETYEGQRFRYVIETTYRR